MSELLPDTYHGNGSTNVPTAASGGNGGTYNPWAAAADDEGGGYNQGPLLKYVKGQWLIGEDEVPLGTQYILQMQDAERGDVLFVDGKPAKQHYGLIREGAQFADPATLRPTGEWCQQYKIEACNVDTGEVVTWISNVTKSKGNKDVIAALMRHYSKVSNTSLLPVVALQTTSYPHPQYGQVHKPVLKHVRWHDCGVVPAAPALAKRMELQARGDMDDDIPF
jgi:hypothetical protein